MNAPLLSPAEGRRQRRALLAEIAREEKKKQRQHLASLRQQIREARAQRKTALLDAKQRCRAERLAARERANAIRQRALQELRGALLAERSQARATCSARKNEARGISERIHRTRVELEAERAFQREMRRIERANRQRAQQVHRKTATERRSESDDSVRSSIPPELVPLWERVKGSIRGSDRVSRLESFLEWVESHPDEHFAAIDGKTDALIRELEARERDVSHAMRSAPAPLPPDYAEGPDSYGIPF